MVVQDFVLLCELSPLVFCELIQLSLAKTLKILDRYSVTLVDLKDVFLNMNLEGVQRRRA